ncbi:MAG: substrate-binding domain-containing protein, partial [Cyanobacteria bacterium Co-bin13]|nr:substrate-binding domain-containing protein [Cyanobacteria bacterium Co-bin13]
MPESVPAGSRLRVGSSASMAALSQALKGEFEAAYAGAEVELEPGSSDEAIASLLAGDIDLAAIGRPLSDAEQAQGLVEVPINREKIAVIIGPDNAFSGGLTFEQFARMFRGEITNWSEVGGPAGPIRFVDRPDFSDTRQSLSTYQVFETAPFEAGATAVQTEADDTAEVIEALGRDGIGFAIANHVLDQDTVQIVPMHGTLPDDPRYPYSQPRGYVYQGEPSPAVAAFLGYVTSPPGEEAIAAARLQEAAAVASALEGAAETPETTATSTTTPPEPGDPAAAVGSGTGAASGGTGQTQNRGGLGWLWILLPLALLGGLLWGLTRKRSTATPIDNGVTPIPQPPEQPPISPAVAAVPPPVPQPEAAPIEPEPVPTSPESTLFTPEATPVEPEPLLADLEPPAAADLEPAPPPSVVESIPIPPAPAPLPIEPEPVASAPPIPEAVPPEPIQPEPLPVEPVASAPPDPEAAPPAPIQPEPRPAEPR